MNETAPPSPKREGQTPRLAGLRAALLLLAGGDRRLADHDGESLDRMWLWMGLLGVGCGLVQAAVWAVSAHAFAWWWQGVSNLPLMPVAAVIALLCFSPLRQTMMAPAQLLGAGSPVAQALTAGAIPCVFALCLLGILPYRHEAIRLPMWLAWLRPMEEYRVLILMPMWGVWAMMVPGHFCRSAEGACRALRGFVNRQPVAATALWMAVPMATTLWQLDFLGAWVALPTAMGLVAGSLGAILVCRGHGGVTRCALLGGNLLTQTAMLVGYLAGKTHCSWM